MNFMNFKMGFVDQRIWREEKRREPISLQPKINSKPNPDIFRPFKQSVRAVWSPARISNSRNSKSRESSRCQVRRFRWSSARRVNRYRRLDGRKIRRKSDAQYLYRTRVGNVNAKRTAGHLSKSVSLAASELAAAIFTGIFRREPLSPSP